MNIEIFKFENQHEIRALVIDNEPYFVGKDVAEILGYERPTKAIQDHCKGVLKQDILSAGGMQSMSIIPERDVYRLIMRSKLPAAEKFEEWVVGEVLPSIRKHGGYIPVKEDESIEVVLSKALVVAHKILQERENKIQQQQTTLDLLVHTDKTYTTTEIAKELGMSSASQLHELLHKHQIIYKRNRTWVLYSKYAKDGLMEIKQKILKNGIITYHNQWTGKGRERILKFIEKIKKENLTLKEELVT
jgi:prophage antirepressor-like protein